MRSIGEWPWRQTQTRIAYPHRATARKSSRLAILLIRAAHVVEGFPTHNNNFWTCWYLLVLRPACLGSIGRIMWDSG